MLRRSLTASFAPGAWVFPGGRVDAGDVGDGDVGGGIVGGGIVGAASAELAAARRAAVRETAEEAGLVIDGAALIPLARWCPPATAARRFLTWILLGRAPDQPVAVDGGEITEHCWVRPAEALAARDRGDLDLLPPTWVTLRTLTPYASAEDVLTSAAAAPPELFETRFIRVAEGLVALWHGDEEYGDTADTTRPGARHRLWMLDTGWRYERHA